MRLESSISLNKRNFSEQFFYFSSTESPCLYILDFRLESSVLRNIRRVAFEEKTRKLHFLEYKKSVFLLFCFVYLFFLEGGDIKTFIRVCFSKSKRKISFLGKKLEGGDQKVRYVSNFNTCIKTLKS